MTAEPAIYDIAILGGGPAGTATALKLKQTTSDLKILLVERSQYDTPRIGESLPPGTTALLDELEAEEDFTALQARPAYGIESAWGQDQLSQNDFLFHTKGHGWVVDRTAFDQRLATLAQRRGVDLRLNSQARNFQQNSDLTWTFELQSESSSSLPARARFIVDASGRRASFARLQGAQATHFDHLLGIHGLFEQADAQPTLIEAFANGWWYSTSLPHGKRLVACFTDSDLARRHHYREHHAWFQALAETATSKTIDLSGPSSALRVAPAHTQQLDRSVGDHWLAVGDAASTYDPLSSQGIFKGIRSGIFAAYAISDFLRTNDGTRLEKYQNFVTHEFEAYLETRTEFYASETRWRNLPFWKRRCESIELHPQTLLSEGSSPSPKRPFQLSDAQTQKVRQLCLSPAPAHQIAAALQNDHPSLSAQRSILGLQHLIRSGIITTSQNAIAT